MTATLNEGERAALDVVLMQIDPRFEDNQEAAYQIAFNILSLRPDIRSCYRSAIRKTMSDLNFDFSDIIEKYELNYGSEHETARETVLRMLVEPFEKVGLL